MKIYLDIDALRYGDRDLFPSIDPWCLTAFNGLVNSLELEVKVWPEGPVGPYNEVEEPQGDTLYITTVDGPGRNYLVDWRRGFTTDDAVKVRRWYERLGGPINP